MIAKLELRVSMLEEKLKILEQKEEEGEEVKEEEEEGKRRRHYHSLSEGDLDSSLLSPTRLLESALLPAAVGAVVGGGVAAVVLRRA